jgi:Tfp pilus assembly protein FimT
MLSLIVMSRTVTKFARATFALAEITIVVTVIALLAATAVPGFFVRQNLGSQRR